MLREPVPNPFSNSSLSLPELQNSTVNMKFTTILFATGIAAVQGMELISENPLCKYEKLSVTAWHNCNDFNGGSDPYKDSDCDMPCARAGRKEAGKFVHVSNYWGSNRCALQCYLK